jgi:hypothetical protein
MLPIAEIRFDGMPDGNWPIVSYAPSGSRQSEDEAPSRLPRRDPPPSGSARWRARRGCTCRVARATAGWTSG